MSKLIVCIGATNARVRSEPQPDGQVILVVEGAGAEKVARLNKALADFKARKGDGVMMVSGPALVEPVRAFLAGTIKEFRGG